MAILTLTTGAIFGACLTAALVISPLPLKVYAQTQDYTKMPGTEGIRIMNVDPGSVFEAMKVESGDTLLEVESRRVQRIQEIEEIFRDIEPGRKVKYKVQRNGKVEEREVEYNAKSAQPPSPTPTPAAKKKK
jgi:S1-C subfamily serine protease